MIKGVTIGDWHSYRHWKLRLSPYTIPLPKPKYNYLDNAGGNGQIDATDALGEICYDDRYITLKLEKIDRERKWESLSAMVANAIHGKRLKVVFDADPDYYYMARCQIVGVVPTGAIGTLTIELRCDPFKYRTDETTVKINVQPTYTAVPLRNLRMPTYPTITLATECTIQYGSGTTVTLPAGTYPMPDIELSEGITTIRVKTTLQDAGIVDGCIIKYRQGSL